MIKSLSGLYGLGTGAEITNYRFTRNMQPIIDVSRDPDALDCSQIFVAAAFETTTEWRLMYTGQSAHSIVYAPDGLTYLNTDQSFLAIKTKSNDVTTGWTKFLDVNGDPKPVLQPSFVVGRFDRYQLWVLTILKEGSTCKAWYVGEGASSVYKVGYATSSDDGETWTKNGTTPIYSDDAISAGNQGIVRFAVLKDATNYKIFYDGTTPNVDGFFIAESTDGITSWTKIHSNLLSGMNLGFIFDVDKIGSNYYIWIQRDFRTGANLGPARRMAVYTSTNLTTWTPVGDQMVLNGSNEFGISASQMFQKPNGIYFSLHTAAKNAAENVSIGTLEPFASIKVAELNRTDSPLANSSCRYSYPSYVQFHAPLGFEMGLSESILGGTGTINSSPLYAPLEFMALNGSQTITFAGISINQTTFAFKMRVETKLTGTHELFRIGNDILVTLETGKLRVRLSSNGSAYQKDYITTANISKPTGITYVDDHIYIGFTFAGGVLKMYNDFVEFTSGQITKTVDTSLTTLNNSGSSILIGQNATIQLRSVSILSGATDQQLIDLDI